MGVGTGHATFRFPVPHTDAATRPDMDNRTKWNPEAIVSILSSTLTTSIQTPAAQFACRFYDRRNLCAHRRHLTDLCLLYGNGAIRQHLYSRHTRQYASGIIAHRYTFVCQFAFTDRYDLSGSAKY